MARAALYSDNEWNSELLGFKVFKVQVQPTARIIGAPVETGMTVFDNKVIDPTKIVVTGTIVVNDTWDSAYGIGDSKAAAKAVIAMLKSRMVGSSSGKRDKLFSLCDGDECYNDLMLESYGKTRESEKYDLSNYELVFRKIMFVQKKNGGLVGEHSDTQKNGFQSGDQL